MPIYEFQCLQCEERKEKYRRIVDIDMLTFCDCGSSMKRLVSSLGATHGDKASWVESTSEMLGQKVTTRTEYNKVLKEKNIVPVG